MPDLPSPTGADLQKIGVAPFPTPGQGLALDGRGRIPPNVPCTAVDVVTADPVSPYIGQMWYRSDTSTFNIRHGASTTKSVTLT